MKKFIKSLLAFAAFTVVFYVIMVCVWGSVVPKKLNLNMMYRIGSNGHMNSRLKEAKQTENVDILFLGSSHAYRGFDTRIFKEAGYNSFNLGSSSQSPIQTEILLKRYLDKLNPKMVVYEVYANTFCSDGVESSLDIIANDKNDAKSLDMAFRQNHIKVYNTLIFGFYSDLMKRNAKYKEKADKGEDHYVRGGFIEKDLRYFKNVKYDKKRKWEFNPAQFAAFERNIALLKKKGIKFVLVQSPITPSLYQSYENNNVFDEKMKKYADSNYYNFNEIVRLNDSLDFNDADHLNQNGVNKFDHQFIEKVLNRK
ncbi:MAG: hypothetical protein CFE23_03340 [Flavobacterium sp. BFFFF1]|uniref:hypothetical protein n=1 Tax=Flavobacterium sp. BFFFF1 TaxID=2015557 RepID=UPI000BC4A993|nr:hypothetical protein [Flavobacterium sp. BFFFF1]OYU81513.1 MAG: hypothetical protein CFE23_03340 [Flavobacterium sp. BFFFF1]